MSKEEVSARERVFRRCPVDVEGISLPEVSSLLGSNERLHIAGLSSCSLSKSGFTAFALSKTSDARSLKAVLGLDGFLAARLVDAALGRSFRSRYFSVRDCSLGEIGALLFAVDRMGKDWLDAGGESFAVRGLLEDTDQIADYLGGPEDLEIRGELRSSKSVFPIRLWCGVPNLGPHGGRRCLKGARSWNVRISVCVGWSVLSIDDVSGVATGDRIVLDSWNHPMGVGGAPSCLLWNGNFHRFGHFVSSMEIEVSPNPEEELKMDKERQVTVSEQKWTLITDEEDDDAGMNVSVRVEVGSLKMRVEDALELVPGRVINLDRPVGPEVKVYVGDKLLGQGVLVDADGVMAVEIKELRRRS